MHLADMAARLHLLANTGAVHVADTSEAPPSKPLRDEFGTLTEAEARTP